MRETIAVVFVDSPRILSRMTWEIVLEAFKHKLTPRADHRSVEAGQEKYLFVLPEECTHLPEVIPTKVLFIGVDEDHYLFAQEYADFHGVACGRYPRLSREGAPRGVEEVYRRSGVVWGRDSVPDGEADAPPAYEEEVME